MPELTIDGKKINVKYGSTILDAAHELGIEIPALCFNNKYQASTSCLVCIVKVNNRLVPSCATKVEEGMVVESETEEIHEARRTALELLLSDHVGDCIAPCQLACPAGMNIPLMIRQIHSSKMQDAINTIKKDIALPAILGRICPAPCENTCRRGNSDEPVSICLLKRYTADLNLKSTDANQFNIKRNKAKKIGIVGAGPAGLSTAYYLLVEGYNCVIFDEHEKPGGTLQYEVPEDKLPRDVIEAEISVIKNMGAEFRMNTRIKTIVELKNDYDAILVATGNSRDLLNDIQINRNTLQTSLGNVFVAGNATGRRSRMAVRSCADGKVSAYSIIQYLSYGHVDEVKRPFTVRMGRISGEEIKKFLENANNIKRVEPSNDKGKLFFGFSDDSTGFSKDEAIAETSRCLHCDCRKIDNCKLKNYSEIYKANPNRYRSERRSFEWHLQHDDIIYEPGKCIDCGLCIQITSKLGERLGLTFIGRGFDVRVEVPFNNTIKEALQESAIECVNACPTGALTFKENK
ncbi:MAG: 2Fe-2S iron-sulfur cluster-binding protein [bacterium]